MHQITCSQTLSPCIGEGAAARDNLTVTLPKVLPYFATLRSRVSEPQAVEICLFPLLWLLALTTACKLAAQAVTMRLSCTVFQIRRLLSKFANFDLLRLRLAPPLGVTPFEFRQDFWHQKTSACRAIMRRCLRHPTFSSFSRTTTCEWQTDTQTETQTQGHGI